MKNVNESPLVIKQLVRVLSVLNIELNVEKDNTIDYYYVNFLYNDFYFSAKIIHPDKELTSGYHGSFKREKEGSIVSWVYVKTIEKYLKNLK